jgi:hypothetical protein
VIAPNHLVPVKLRIRRLPENNMIPAINRKPAEFTSVPGHLVVAHATAIRASP